MLAYVRYKGSVLLVSLVFLLMISLISVSMMQHAILGQKFSINGLRYYQGLLLADSVLSMAEKTLTQSACVSSTLLSTRLLRENQGQFWQSSLTCKGSIYDYEYQFIIEALAQVPCGYLLESDILGVEYFRVTARIHEPGGMRQRIVQSSFALSVEEGVVCDNPDTGLPIKPGRQAWRQLL